MGGGGSVQRGVCMEGGLHGGGSVQGGGVCMEGGLHGGCRPYRDEIGKPAVSTHPPRMHSCSKVLPSNERTMQSY